MAKVFIGIGHGGADPGAVSGGFKESFLALSIGLACIAELERHGVKVKASRTKDENDPLNDEIKECNAYAPDLAVDIHINAGGGDGAEAWHTKNGGKGATLAKNILSEIEKIGQNSRGAKTRTNSKGADYYGFIRETSAPAVIVECAFIDNKKDIAIIDTAAEQKAFGKAIAKGILKTLGIAYKEVKKVAYKDAKEIPSWAKEAVEKVTEHGYMMGDDQGKFRPNDPITRAEMAVILCRQEML
jgi:N-acetylmuramoyl-L-alanine amidase